jgi:hypothetical protein
MSNRVGIPEPRADVNSLMATVQALREQVQILTGERGDTLDRSASLSDLSDFGLVRASYRQDGSALLNPITQLVAFTPTVTFATPGNLTVSYVTRQGVYYRVGRLVFVTVALRFTPTYTTASGNLRIPLPVPPLPTPTTQQLAAQINTTSTWQSGATSVVAYAASTDDLRFVFMGSGLIGSVISASHLPTGVEVVTLRASGVYLAGEQ